MNIYEFFVSKFEFFVSLTYNKEVFNRQKVKSGYEKRFCAEILKFLFLTLKKHFILVLISYLEIQKNSGSLIVNAHFTFFIRIAKKNGCKTDICIVSNITHSIPSHIEIA